MKLNVVIFLLSFGGVRTPPALGSWSLGCVLPALRWLPRLSGRPSFLLRCLLRLLPLHSQRNRTPQSRAVGSWTLDHVLLAAGSRLPPEACWRLAILEG